jgi:hypothetical protein
MPIAPTLILGLGGTGSHIVQKVYEKVQETGGKQSERIAYVAFDTDINDLAEIRRRTPEIYTVQTSTRSTVGEYLNINTNARDKWFPVNEMLNRKALTEGAAQVRAISRLAFDTTLKGGNLDELHRAVDQLFRIDKDQQEQALRVIITSSLAGGTGSGLILPVAMYLANFLRTKYPKAKAITRGFFIQPDVFFTVINATEEQQNLQVNAYAAVRELDAFLMKADNTLPPEYQNLVFEFPQVGGDGVTTINAMPYDFCFLFDANNTSGGALDSFAGYKDHAATCIYTQSLGPMSKKSNSREDNVLREVIKHDGRNRYAGAGASRLVYPWKHLRDYVALKWADQALSSQWLTFDDQIRERREALAKQREQGFAVQDLDVGREFIELVDAAVGNKDPFARSIRNQCLIFDEEGLDEVGQRWLEYVTELKGHVQRQAEKADDPGAKTNCRSRIGRLSGEVDRRKYVPVYRELERYQKKVAKKSEEVSGVIAYSLFQAENASVTKDRNPHQMETYLREKLTNSFLHPVAARYFLYQTREALVAERQRVGAELQKTKAFFESFEKGAFVNADEAGADMSPEQWGNGGKTLRERVLRKPGAELVDLSSKYSNYVRKVDELRSQEVYYKVLEEAITYVNGVSDAYERLFTNLAQNLKALQPRIALHRTKHDNLKGSTTRYVLADSQSLDFMNASMPYTGGVMSLDSDLSEGIYMKVRDYHMLTDERDLNYFQSLYEDDILGYFRDDVDKSYGANIRFDIIDALEREYLASEHDYEEDGAEHYVKKEIDKVKKLAAPFLEQPLGEERHPIHACAYNPKIAGDSDPKRKALVAEELGNYGGQPDPEISTQEILFYNAIYGIRASDLSKYSPERFGTDKRPAGGYFTAYYGLVSHIRPTVEMTRVITPHIDRRWHTVAALPDLDDGYQAKQFYEINRAFVGGVTLGVITWQPMYTGLHLYRYMPYRDIEQGFVVSNGSPCDKFYEVLDSLMIDPVAVTSVNEAVDHKVTDFLEDKPAATFAGSPLGEKMLGGIDLPELAKIVPAMENRRKTLLDIPTMYAASVPKSEFSEVRLRQLTVDMLNYVMSEIRRVEDENKTVPTMEQVLVNVMKDFPENARLYEQQFGQPFAKRIRTILGPVGDLAEELRLGDVKKAVEELEKDLRKQ